MRKLLISIISCIQALLSLSPVLAHTGHPEDQMIDGIDNNVLTFLALFVAMIIVAIVAFLQGKKAAGSVYIDSQAGSDTNP